MYVFISLEVELLCQMTTPCLTFLRTCQTFSKWLHHFTISLAVPEDPSFSASSPRLVPVYLLYGCEAVSHCDSDLHVPNDIKQLFMWLVAICVSSLEDCLFKSSAHFSFGIFVFYCWVVRVPYMLWIQMSYMWLTNIFSQLSFTFLMAVLIKSPILNVDFQLIFLMVLLVCVQVFAWM